MEMKAVDKEMSFTSPVDAVGRTSTGWVNELGAVAIFLFKRRKFTGQAFLLLVPFYAVARFLLEIIRGDKEVDILVSAKGKYLGIESEEEDEDHDNEEDRQDEAVQDQEEPFLSGLHVHYEKNEHAQDAHPHPLYNRPYYVQGPVV